MLTKALVVGAVLLGGLTVAPAAHAQDHRNCVSLREFRGTHYVGQGRVTTRRSAEDRWEVRGLGVRVGPAQWDYPACGYSMDEVSVSIETEASANMRVSTLDLRVRAVARVRYATAAGLRPHGHV